MPSFGALDIAEAAGLGGLNPEAAGLDALVADLVAGIDPPRLSAMAVAKTLRESADWPDAHPTLATWFEDNVAKLNGSKRAPRASQMATLLTGPLQARRRRWAGLAAWMALSLKHRGNADWQGFAILAQELLGKRSLDEVGLMRAIAATTLEVIGVQQLLGAGRAA